ncbi:MAG: MBL fold metallo-hydrolase [Thermodesulfobacteriota bacterium]|nr:MBL fold metallo-hydrolase [Thermodesulfobacteriota bacterium]
MIKGMLGIAFLWPFISFYWGRQKADAFWEEKCKEWSLPKGIGTTKGLRVLPLIDWYTKDKNLATEPGVSYLIKTEKDAILFDLGYNVHNEHPSPLLRNMSRLGISLDDINAIVISHPHVDHIGGMKNQLKKTFSLTNDYIDLSDKDIFLPPGMSRSDLNTMQVYKPIKIAKGVISTGPIYSSQFLIGNTLFPMGITPEQALVVDVKDKGLIILVGCGHQGLDRILQLVDQLYKKPIYGVIGGLHFPVTKSRISKFGGKFQVQQYLGTGKLPWDPITKEEVMAQISNLKSYNPSLVSLSAHDSCDWSIEAFKDAFGPCYKELLVGEEIQI